MIITPGHTLSGKYRVERLIARGRMDAVYQATQLGLGTPVALRVFTPRCATDPAFQRRFAQEAQLIAALRHPHIVAVIDFAADAGQSYLVMELVRGGALPSLSHELRPCPGSPLPVPFAVELVRHAAEGLAYAHDQGVIHRDIKPGNLLVEQVRGAGGARCYQLKVTDFGLARLVGLCAGGPALSSVFHGTPEYAAPEQLRPAPLDARCDIFALGAVLYELLAGRLPGAGAHAADVLVGPRALRPEVAPELDRLVLACLARDPACRPSADELAAALAALQPPTAAGYRRRDGTPTIAACCLRLASTCADPSPDAATVGPASARRYRPRLSVSSRLAVGHFMLSLLTIVLCGYLIRLLLVLGG